MAIRPNDLSPDERFINGLLRNMIVSKKARGTRWSYIGLLCGVGSTQAMQLCRWYGYDPDEKVRLRTFQELDDYENL